MQTLMLRPVRPEGSTSRPGAAKCQLDACGQSTREGKPYCSQHIENGTYVQGILKELELRETEADLLDRGKSIDDDGHLVRESLLLLEQGGYTAARLARLLDITHAAAETLIRFMAKKKLAKMGRTERGATTIEKIMVNLENEE